MTPNEGVDNHRLPEEIDPEREQDWREGVDNGAGDLKKMPTLYADGLECSNRDETADRPQPPEPHSVLHDDADAFPDATADDRGERRLKSLPPAPVLWFLILIALVGIVFLQMAARNNAGSGGPSFNARTDVMVRFLELQWKAEYLTAESRGQILGSSGRATMPGSPGMTHGVLSLIRRAPPHYLRQPSGLRQPL